jgi:hypothetical protein
LRCAHPIAFAGASKSGVARGGRLATATAPPPPLPSAAASLSAPAFSACTRRRCRLTPPAPAGRARHPPMPSRPSRETTAAWRGAHRQGTSLLEICYRSIGLSSARRPACPRNRAAAAAASHRRAPQRLCLQHSIPLLGRALRHFLVSLRGLHPRRDFLEPRGVLDVLEQSHAV